MVFTKEELYNQTINAPIDRLSLSLLLEYYEYYLMPFEFTYDLENSEKINVFFSKENFCHLIGIEKIIGHGPVFLHQAGTPLLNLTGYHSRGYLKF